MLDRVAGESFLRYRFASEDSRQRDASHMDETICDWNDGVTQLKLDL